MRAAVGTARQMNGSFKPNRVYNLMGWTPNATRVCLLHSLCTG